MLSATPSEAGHRVEVAVSVTNAAPPGLPTYVQGPQDEDLGPGSHLGILTSTSRAAPVT
ncbi:MAG: hypothetical protein R2716_01435 [Microthrixaceae bacterium]